MPSHIDRDSLALASSPLPPYYTHIVGSFIASTARVSSEWILHRPPRPRDMRRWRTASPNKLQMRGIVSYRKWTIMERSRGRRQKKSSTGRGSILSAVFQQKLAPHSLRAARPTLHPAREEAQRSVIVSTATLLG